MQEQTVTIMVEHQAEDHGQVWLSQLAVLRYTLRFIRWRAASFLEYTLRPGDNDVTYYTDETNVLKVESKTESDFNDHILGPITLETDIAVVSRFYP